MYQTERKLNMEDFNKKYETQRQQWERVKSLKPKPVDPEMEGISESSFKP